MAAAGSTDLTDRVVAEQIRAHYSQFPAMAIAPTAGATFTAWVLWDVVPKHYLVAGVALVAAIALTRLILYLGYRRAAQTGHRRWGVYTVVAAFVSGCVWGSAAPLLYPPLAPGYEMFVLVLLALVPIVPVAGLASYMPAFYAYFVPCVTPFVVLLVLHGGRPELLTAILLLMMMAAMATFAHRHSKSLAEAVRLRLELAEKSDALEQANRQRSQFVAAAAHDLRQPVHSIGLFLESLRHDAAASGGAQWLDHIAASLASLRHMLTNMLDLSRLDAAALTPRPVDFSAADLLLRLHDEFAPLAARRRIALRCRAGGLAVRSDPALLERIVRNLLSNALKCTSRGGIVLACRPRGAAVSIEVWDTGIGIRQEHLQSIFREFTQFERAEGVEGRGLGLGLAIVRRLCDALGHSVQVQSRFGRGSVFRVEVARGQAPVQPPAPIAAAPDVSGALVAVIDDDEGIRAGAAALLRRWGCRVVVAETAEAAATQLDALGATPDVLLVDYLLRDGVHAPETIAHLQRRLGKPVPAIVITGDTASLPTREAYAAGHMLLHKPVDPIRLKACIAALRAPAG